MVFLTSRSLTLAQQIDKTLRRNRIHSKIVRPDIGITDGSCGYAVVISEIYLPEALDVLKRNGVMPRKVMIEELNGDIREIPI